MIAKEAWEDARAGAVEAIKAHLTDRYVDHDAEEIAWNVLNIIADMWDEQEAADRAEAWDEGYQDGLRQGGEGEDGPRYVNPYRAAASTETTTATAEDARAEAWRRFPDGIDVETGEPVDDYGYPATAREAFIGGAEWAAASTETTTATTEDAARVMRDEWMQYGPEVTWLHMARALDAHGLLAKARTLPTREQIARALREGRTNGLCKPGVRCDMCDCAQDYEDDLALRDADTVLTLLADHHHHHR